MSNVYALQYLFFLRIKRYPCNVIYTKPFQTITVDNGIPWIPRIQWILSNAKAFRSFRKRNILRTALSVDFSVKSNEQINIQKKKKREKNDSISTQNSVRVQSMISMQNTRNEWTKKSDNEAKIHDEIQIGREMSCFYILPLKCQHRHHHCRTLNRIPLPISNFSITHTHTRIHHVQVHVHGQNHQQQKLTLHCLHANENGFRLILNAYYIIHKNIVFVPSSAFGRACINKWINKMVYGPNYRYSYTTCT